MLVRNAEIDEFCNKEQNENKNISNHCFIFLILYGFIPPQMTPQQRHEHREEPFFVDKRMLPTVVPPTAELEREDRD